MIHVIANNFICFMPLRFSSLVRRTGEAWCEASGDFWHAEADIQGNPGRIGSRPNFFNAPNRPSCRNTQTPERNASRLLPKSRSPLGLNTGLGQNFDRMARAGSAYVISVDSDQCRDYSVRHRSCIRARSPPIILEGIMLLARNPLFVKDSRFSCY